jgi:hypothetical protein
LTTLTHCDANANPEELYKKTTDQTARRRLQTAVVLAFRDRIAALVRGLAPREHRAEAEQVGALGVLVALEKYDPGRKEYEPEKGSYFWNFARSIVLDEIQRWMDQGVYWRKSANRGKSPERVAQREAAQSQRHVASLDAETAIVPMDPSPTVEELLGNAEGEALVRQFAATLTPDDRHLLLCEKRERGNPNSPRLRHYQSLVERLTAFVKGSDGDGSRDPVSRGVGASRVDRRAEARRGDR